MLIFSLSLRSAGIDIDRLQRLAFENYGDSGRETVAKWHEMVGATRGKPTQQQLTRVNDFFNTRIRWLSDQDIYSVDDHWATPLETMGRLAGDCEDFVIAKYVSLILAGVSPESLRLIYVKARAPGRPPEAHMVLAWYETPGSEPLILDNMNLAIRPASKRADLTPIFSFNGDGLWLASKKTNATPVARITRWRLVLQTMRQEGIDPGF
ncbi:periplasmic protein [Luminiphilus syltensis NOR5-1B]|uniref:Periplasmic protein n=1 Tax=Luminiphilus syltensis NOR5-1B TaxID=565045 RepID=B8KRF6_9GAMM|nr:periplasmic protein [Luminiphilus syltensis NOR5-1B]